MDDRKNRLYSKAEGYKSGGWNTVGSLEYTVKAQTEKVEPIKAAAPAKPLPVPVKPPIPGMCDLKNCALAMAYVPMQQWKETYDTDTALDRGTIFPELDLPFLGEGAKIDE